MMRNDYRRSLILLRGNASGYSGHVRLERRTLMGTMYFVLQAPENARSLQAALVGRGREDYFACPLGELRRDGRGQATLGYSFDPRNICGRALEDYQLIAVAEAGEGACSIVLYGNVCGHADLNWERVQQALCLSLNPGPGRESAAGEKAAEEAAVPMEEILLEEKIILEEGAVPAETSSAAEDVPERERTAGEMLELDMLLPWPDCVEGLRNLFMEQEALKDAPQNGYSYVSLPLPSGSPYPAMAAGIRVENGAPAAVCYAIPSPWSAEPPAGLEEYEWLGDNNRGWWIVEIVL